MVVITEIFLYVSFALLMGGLIVQIVPEGKKTVVIASKKLLLSCVLLIPLLSLAPLLNVIFILSEGMDFWVSFWSILFTFEIGKAWWFTIAVSVLLFMLLLKNDLKANSYIAKVGIALTVLLAFGVGKAGHAASITQWFGFVVHSAHFLAVIVWSGILLTVACFSKDLQNWPAFLKWFTPLSVVCTLIIAAAGFFTMEIDIQSYDDPNSAVWTEYKNSWLINYGQALLIKHLLYIPLLLFALFNGFILRSRRNATSAHRPLVWIRIESLYVMLMYGATAYMGQQTPPHQLAQTLQISGPSPLFAAIYKKEIQPGMNVLLDFQTISYVLFAFFILFVGFSALSICKKKPRLSLWCSILTMLTAYLGIMLGVK